EAGSFVAPGLDYLISTLEYGKAGGFKWLGTPQDFLDKTHTEEELEAAIVNVGKAYKRGMKGLIGSDFGFSWFPHGPYAPEFLHLVKLVGYKPMEPSMPVTKRE